MLTHLLADWWKDLNRDNISCMNDESVINILKPVWTREKDGRWGIHDFKGMSLKPKKGFSPDFFALESNLELIAQRPPQNIGDMFAALGTTDILLKQSILPVVAWVILFISVPAIRRTLVISSGITVVVERTAPKRANIFVLKKWATQAICSFVTARENSDACNGVSGELATNLRTCLQGLLISSSI